MPDDYLRNAPKVIDHLNIPVNGVCCRGQQRSGSNRPFVASLHKNSPEDRGFREIPEGGTIFAVASLKQWAEPVRRGRS